MPVESKAGDGMLTIDRLELSSGDYTFNGLWWYQAPILWCACKKAALC